MQATEAAAVRAVRLAMQEQEHAAAVEAERQRRAAEPLGSVQLMVAGPSSRERPPPLDEDDELARTILEMVTAADDAEGDSSSRQGCLRRVERAERARQRERDEQMCRLLGAVAARARERARKSANVQAEEWSATAEAPELAERRATEAAELAERRATEAHRAAAKAVEQWSRSALAPQLRSGRQARQVAASVMSVFEAEASVLYANSK